MCPWYILLWLVQVPLRLRGWVCAAVGALLCTRLKEREKKKKKPNPERAIFAEDSACPGSSFTAFNSPEIRAAFFPPLFSFLPLPPAPFSMRRCEPHRSCSSRGAEGRAGPRRRRGRRAGSAVGRSAAARCRASPAAPHRASSRCQLARPGGPAGPPPPPGGSPGLLPSLFSPSFPPSFHPSSLPPSAEAALGIRGTRGVPRSGRGHRAGPGRVPGGTAVPPPCQRLATHSAAIKQNK